MSRLLFLLVAFSYAAVPLHAQYVGFNQKEIKELKRLTARKGGAADSMMKVADAAMEEVPHPIDTIRTEGLLMGDPRKTATQAALWDMNKVYALALAYRVKGDKKYLNKAAEFLTAWAKTNHSKGDPIDDTNLDRIIEAYDLLKEKLEPAREGSIRGWLRVTAQTEITAPYNRPGRATSYNNWHSHRLKIVGEIAYAIGDTALQGYTVRELLVQIAKNLNPDGSSSDFVSRDALHYHVYDLEPLLKLAIVLKRATATDYYAYTSPGGTSIKRSVDWVIPYLNGQQTHAEFVNSTVEFDRKRARNNEAAYKAGTLFEPKNGIGTLVLAAYFDAGLLPLARQLMQTEGTNPWQVTATAVMRGALDL